MKLYSAALIGVLFGAISNAGANPPQSAATPNPPPSGHGQCDEYIAAIVKFDHTPHREVADVSFTSPNGTVTGIKEEIFTGDTVYSSSRSGWSSSPKTGDQMARDFLKSWDKAATTTCTPKGSETVDGQLADVISLHSADQYLVTDSTWWVSQSSSLPLKSEFSIASSFPAGPTSLKQSTKYAYDDVHPPSGDAVPQ